MDPAVLAEDLKQVLSPVQESDICRTSEYLRAFAKLLTLNRLGLSGLVCRLARCRRLIRLRQLVFLALTPQHLFFCFAHALKFLLPLNKLVLTLPCHIPPAFIRRGLCRCEEITFSPKKTQRPF